MCAEREREERESDEGSEDQRGPERTVHISTPCVWNVCAFLHLYASVCMGGSVLVGSCAYIRGLCGMRRAYVYSEIGYMSMWGVY